jgi:hypothetical protein
MMQTGKQSNSFVVIEEKKEGPNHFLCFMFFIFYVIQFFLQPMLFVATDRSKFGILDVVKNGGIRKRKKKKSKQQNDIDLTIIHSKNWFFK